MAQNPYEAPRMAEPTKEAELSESGSIRQLLIEIRDAQYEMLQLHRQALGRTRRHIGFTFALSVVPFLLLTVFLYYLTIRPRVMPQIPARPASRALP